MSLIFNHVSFMYDADTNLPSAALQDINLTIEDGGFYGLIGHTGSGKSTLVQHMNGLLHPTHGEVYFDGEDISEKGYDLKKLRSKVGLVFQYPEHQLFEATVFDDVCFGPKNMGLSKSETELRAFAALESVGLSHDYYYSSPFDLSGGQKRRVAIAGVLAMKPSILVLDEPTAGLDPRGRDEILDQIKKLHEEERISIVLVSHSMEDVANYVEKILVMNKGKLIYNDVPAEVFKHVEELEAIGLAAPQVSYITKALREQGFDIDTSVTTIKAAADEVARLLR